MSDKPLKVLLIPDTHVPNHHRNAFKLALKIGAAIKPQTVVILGDFGDFEAVSSYSKSPDKQHLLVQEVGAVHAALDQIKKAIPRAKRYVYCAGNHEDRLSRYLRDKAPELFGITSVPEILRLEEKGWEFLDYHEPLILGNCIIQHDFGSHGSTAVKNAFRSIGGTHSSVIGHVHRQDYQVRQSITDRVVVSACFGWLGDVKKITYRAICTDWSHGVGIGYLFGTTLDLKPVTFYSKSKKAIVEGRLISI